MNDEDIKESRERLIAELFNNIIEKIFSVPAVGRMYHHYFL
jgi:hypothetical protein